MKHVIYPEYQGTPTANSEDTNFPATNLLTDYRKQVWKSDGLQTATLRVPISANSSVISLHGTNAETAICTITLDSAEQTLDAEAAVELGGGRVTIPLTAHGYLEGQTILFNGTDNYDDVYTLASQASGGDDDIVISSAYSAETFDGDETACIAIESTTHDLTTPVTLDRFWQEYTEQVAAHHATIKLTAGSGETVEAGVVRAGGLLTFVNPQYGASQSPKDYSIIKELRNGALYIKKRDIVRKFSYTMEMLRSLCFELLEHYDNYGPEPFTILIDDALNNDNLWCFFGSFESEPKVSHAYPEHSTISISILEAV